MSQNNVTQYQGSTSRLHTGGVHRARVDGSWGFSGYICLDRDGRINPVVQRKLTDQQWLVADRSTKERIGYADAFSAIIGDGAGPSQWTTFYVFPNTNRSTTFSVVVFTAWRSLLFPDRWYKTRAEAYAAVEAHIGEALQELRPEWQEDPSLDPEAGRRPYAFKRLRPDRTGGFPALPGTVIVPSYEDFSL